MPYGKKKGKMSKGFAGLSGEVRQEAYPKRSYAMKENNMYPDNLSQIDKNCNQDAKKVAASMRKNY